LVRFIPTIILPHPLAPRLKIISTGFMVPFSYDYIKYIDHIHPPLTSIYPHPLTSTCFTSRRFFVLVKIQQDMIGFLLSMEFYVVDQTSLARGENAEGGTPGETAKVSWSFENSKEKQGVLHMHKNSEMYQLPPALGSSYSTASFSYLSQAGQRSFLAMGKLKQIKQAVAIGVSQYIFSYIMTAQVDSLFLKTITDL
jgi:hypothetical protein